MRRNWKVLVLVVLCVLALYAGYRIVAHTVADGAVAEDPARALRAIPGHPDALLALAQAQLEAGDHQAAADSSRRLLGAAPLEGRGWRILAQVEDAAGNTPQARALYERAVARRPRDIPSRIWLARHYLLEGDYPATLEQIDRVSRYSPQHTGALQPVVATLAQDPAFVEALVPVLARGPRWRAAFLREVQNGNHPEAAERILPALRDAGGLSAEEYERWISGLMRQGQWGEAYVHWIASLPAGARLTPVFNGGFDRLPGNSGFDWRTPRVPGVTLLFQAQGQGDGHIAHFTFRRRQVARAGLEQPLLLAPGQAYRLTARMRARELRGEFGLEWTIQCAAGSSRVLARSTALAGSFDWRSVELDFEVPADCTGQWLRLRNPAPRGVAQYLSGELWVDDVAITPENT